MLERAPAACEAEPAADKYLDVLESHHELAEAYDRLGRVEDALRHADVLVRGSYQSQPYPRCRGAEISGLSCRHQVDDAVHGDEQGDGVAATSR